MTIVDMPVKPKPVIQNEPKREKDLILTVNNQEKRSIVVPSLDDNSRHAGKAKTCHPERAKAREGSNLNSEQPRKEIHRRTSSG
jgi:hypothetical protein